jgi:hypothetical protein
MSRSVSTTRFYRLLLASLATVMLIGLASSPAGANHVWGGTYNGTVEGGGTVTFTISGDGNTVTSFQIQNVPGTPCTITQATVSNIPITNHSFTRTASSGLSATGSFPSPGNAQGTISFSQSFPPPGCTTGTRNWTATAPVPPPKDVSLKAKPKTVEKGDKAKLTAKVSPCGGHEGDLVEFYRGNTLIGTKASSSSCVAKMKVKVRKTSKFQAVSPMQDTDHSAGTSNKVKVKAVRD